MNGISKAKSLKEAKKILIEEYGYSEYDISVLFDDNTIMAMVNDFSNADMSRELSISIDSLNISDENANKINFVIKHIKQSVNIYKDYIRFYHIIDGNIFYNGRKVMYEGKRYTVIYSDYKKAYLTDNTRFFCILLDEIKIINEKIVFQDIRELFEATYDLMKDKIELVSYIEIFSHIYDIDIKSILPELRTDMKESVINHLKPYAEKANLDLNDLANFN